VCGGDIAIVSGAGADDKPAGPNFAPERLIPAGKLKRVLRLEDIRNVKDIKELKRIVKRILVRTLAAVLLLSATVYSGDYLVARLRGATAISTVEVQVYYAVPLRSGKTEFMMLTPEDQTCVRSMLPHFGYSPCWYLDGRTLQRVNM